ncbi:MAG: DUF58 domain-containing protein [Vulcanimicrobiota bacterium]
MKKIKEFLKKYLDELILIGIAYFLFRVTVNIQSGWLLFIIAFIFGILILSFFTSIWNLKNLTIRRTFKELNNEEDDVKVSFTLENESRFAKYFIVIEDPFPSLYPQDKNPRLFFPYIPGRDKSTKSYKRRAYKRGIYFFDKIKIYTLGILGFFHFTKKMPVEKDKITVLPQSFNVSRVELIKNDRKFSYTDRPVKSFGRSYDFAGIREYQPGEETRFIHWRLTAKFSHLMLKEFNSPSSRRAAMVLDCESGSEIGTGKKTTTEYMVKFAATVIDSMSGNNNRIDLFYADPNEVIIKPGNNQLNSKVQLAEVKAGSSVKMEQLLEQSVQNLLMNKQVYIFKVFPFENLGPLEFLAKRGIKMNLVFLKPGSFADEQEFEGLNDIYSSQVEKLREMGVDARMFKMDENPVSAILSHRRNTVVR